MPVCAEAHGTAEETLKFVNGGSSMMVKLHRQRRDALAGERPQRRKKNGVPIFKHMTAKSLDA